MSAGRQPKGTGSEGADGLPSDLLRGLTASRLSRRRLLQSTAGLAATASFAGLLSACGIEGTRDTGWEQGFDWEAWWAKQEQTDTLTFANWPLYIDRVKGGSPSLEQFTEETGIEVNYRPVIQDNSSFFSQIAPVLQSGQGIGYDLIVISEGWELTQMIRNHWLIPLDQSRLQNFRKYGGPTTQDPSYDPGNTYTATWQSGITGIGYDPEATGREITSVKDLFDPAFAGKVGMMSDTTEIGSAGMLALGIDPVSSNPEQWQEAADLLQRQRDDGIVRQYYDQAYIKALQDGDTWISLAWSGDVFQSQVSGYPNLKFVIPEEGGMLWHDTISIPYHAAHPFDAMTYIDYCYDPQVQAEIEAWVNYVCPVPDAQPLVQEAYPRAGNSPLVFPTADMYRQTREYYTFENIGDREEWLSIFDPIVQS